MTRVLFVCLGNICRSPLAEDVFRSHVVARGLEAQFEIDSAGTGDWHAGELADPRMRATARRHGVELTSRARQARPEDAQRFDHLVCMDRSNVANLRGIVGASDKITLLLEEWAAAPVDEVPDPYYGGDDGFENVYALVDAACVALLDRLAG